jgi:predicted transposase YdaD
MATKPFDPTVKTLVETSPGDWPVLLGLPAAPTEVIDADIATVSGAGDKALRVHTASPYLIHLDFQSGHDSAKLRRLLHLRSTLLEYRHGQLVRSAAVLLRPEADTPALTGERRLGFPGEVDYDVFRYQVLRVWQLPPQVLLGGGLGTLALAPISAVTEAELPGIIKQMDARLQTRRWRRHADEIWSATFILMGLRYSRELARHLLQGVRSMKESVTYQAILEEGEAKGRSEGAIEGALTEARKILQRLGQRRFGPPDTRVRTILEGITDVERLEELSERVYQVHSWEELLSLPTPRRPSPRRRPKA